MGYNTALLFLNDRWHEAMNNPILWVESIDVVMREGGQAAFQTTVMQTMHADTPRLYLSRHNSLREISAYSDMMADAKTDKRLLQFLKEDSRMARDLLDNYDRKLKRYLPS